ncbi:MAG: hypothetical protein H6739_06510 [Alphaproteobacteria bacterium]|nr:hypothetical protein [Alphaproteobacteria bacterium]
MEPLPLALTATALALSAVHMGLWVWAGWAVQVRRWLSTLLVLAGLSVVWTVVALALGAPPLVLLALPAPVMFLGLHLIAEQPAKRAAVQVGDPILTFEALDGEGRPFHLASMSGRPYLLKFYRGHW